MRWSILLLGPILIILASAAPSNSTRLVDAVSLPIVSVESFDDCDIRCDEWCPGGYHDAWFASVSNATSNGGSHPPENPCWSGTCATKHGPLCEIDGFAAGDHEPLRVALVRGDIAGIQDVLNRNPGAAQVNTDRSAIQVLNCRGEVVAHLPLSRGTLVAMSHHDPEAALIE